MISLVNKTFFVTGLGSGIGYETGKLIKSLGGNLTGTIENEDQSRSESEGQFHCASFSACVNFWGGRGRALMEIRLLSRILLFFCGNGLALHQKKDHLPPQAR